MNYIYDIVHFENLICNSSKYYAHLPKEGESRKPETLAEHSSLVYAYAKELCRRHNLNGIITSLIDESIPCHLGSREKLKDMMDELFWQSIAYHDLGKVNHNFQLQRMNNNDKNILIVDHSFEHQHAKIGVYLFLALYFKRLMNSGLEDDNGTLEFISNVALYLSYPMYKHHASCLNKCQDIDNWDCEELNKLSPYLSLIDGGMDKEIIESYHDCLLANANFDCLFKIFNEQIFNKECGFSLYALVRLNYSLLTASDYLATAHYMNGWTEMITNFGIMDEPLRSKIIANARESKSYNKLAFEKANNGDILTKLPMERNNSNLNLLRTNLAAEVISNVRKNKDKRLFYIEAPTGAGKTNVSMLAMSELLRLDSSLQKVCYVFPFTTLITQTFKAIKDTLGLDGNEVAEIHSKAAYQTGEYEDDYHNFINCLMMNYPVSLLSHVKFFDILKTNDKETNYLMHRLSNCVVIIDELQSYSPQIWDKMVYFISNYAHYFNMKFILMSATLPKIGDLAKVNSCDDFVYLVSDKKRYFQNPNFCNRVTFDYTLFERERPNKDALDNYLVDLSKFVDEKSNEYAESNTLHPNSVFTIVEFIFKNTADKFYSLYDQSNKTFDHVFLLSGTILEARRQQIIKALKSDEYRKKKVLLVTTQVVEAGVDIDMDLGFKDKSLIDSEEQLAGRINRNVNKPDCKLYVFDCNTEKTLYGGDDRFVMMRQMGMDVYKEILGNKDFDRLYNLIMEHIDRRNNSQFVRNIDDLHEGVNTLDYFKVNKLFKIIDSQSQSVFIPLKIDTNLLSQEHIEAAKELGISISDHLDGIDVWSKYVQVLCNQLDFIETKIILKKLQGLLSCFSISIFPNGKEYNALKTYGEEKYGYLFIENHQSIYSLEDGIMISSLGDYNFL